MDFLLVLACLLCIIFGLPIEKPDDGLNELIGMQKMHDLEKIWIEEHEFDFEEMKKDALIVFGNNRFELQLDQQTFEHHSDYPWTKKTATETVFVSSTHQPLFLRLILYHQ